MFLLLLFSVFAISIVDAGSVDAWPDQVWPLDGNIDLLWTTENLKGCWLSVQRIYIPDTSGPSAWPSLPIRNNWSLTDAYLSWNDLFTQQWWDYEIELRVFTDGMCSDSSVSYTDFTWSMNLCVPNDWYVCDGWSASSTWDDTNWWASRSTRMRRQAEKLFKTPEAIDKIDLLLKKHSIAKNILFGLTRNYIGWDGKVKYEIDYSNTRDFQESKLLDQYRSNETTSRSYNIYVHDLDPEYITHYFRVRAFYKDKYSNWSNIIEYINEDNPLSQYVVECIDCENKINFWDIFVDPEVLIEENLKTLCDQVGGRWCTQSDVDYSDILDNIFYVPFPTYYKITR